MHGGSEASVGEYLIWEEEVAYTRAGPIDDQIDMMRGFLLKNAKLKPGAQETAKIDQFDLFSVD